MAKNKEKDTAKTEETKKKGLNPIVIIVLIVVVLGGGAFGGVYLFMQNNVDKEEPIKEVKVPIVEEITVNLSGNEGGFVKTGVYLSYDEENSDLGEEITEKTVEIQDKTTFYLKSRKTEDFEAANEEKLKNELIAAINSVLSKGEIVNVYFPTGILVQ